MKIESAAFWDRAVRAMAAAGSLVEIDPDGAASRAYFAAFHAVSALFAEEGQTFTRHTAVAAAVHRDLVKTGRWSVDLGKAYSWLLRARHLGDYGQDLRVSPEEARESVEKASRILGAVQAMLPDAR